MDACRASRDRIPSIPAEGRRRNISNVAGTVESETPSISVTVSEASSPLDEPQFITRGKRLAHLAGMVFTLMMERYQAGTITEFDRVEDADLIDALRACGAYTEQIGCLNFDDLTVALVN